MRSPKNKAEVGKHAKQAGERTLSEAVNYAGGMAETTSEQKPGGAVEKNRV